MLYQLQLSERYVKLEVRVYPVSACIFRYIQSSSAQAQFFYSIYQLKKCHKPMRLRSKMTHKNDNTTLRFISTSPIHRV